MRAIFTIHVILLERLDGKGEMGWDCSTHGGRRLRREMHTKLSSKIFKETNHYWHTRIDGGLRINALDHCGSRKVIFQSPCLLVRSMSSAFKFPLIFSSKLIFTPPPSTLLMTYQQTTSTQSLHFQATTITVNLPLTVILLYNFNPFRYKAPSF